MECSADDDYVTSVAWAADGKHVSVGTSSAQVQVACLFSCAALISWLAAPCRTSWPHSGVTSELLPSMGQSGRLVLHALGDMPGSCLTCLT